MKFKLEKFNLAYARIIKEQTEVKNLKTDSFTDDEFLEELDKAKAMNEKALYLASVFIIQNPNASIDVLLAIFDKINGDPYESNVYCNLAKSEKLNKELEDKLLNLKINSFKVDECLAANPNLSDEGKQTILNRYSENVYKLRKLKYAMTHHAVMKRKIN